MQPPGAGAVHVLARRCRYGPRKGVASPHPRTFLGDASLFRGSTAQATFAPMTVWSTYGLRNAHTHTPWSAAQGTDEGISRAEQRLWKGFLPSPVIRSRTFFFQIPVSWYT